MPKSFRDQLRETKAEAKVSGKRIRKVFDKEGFSREFPNFKRDPRSAFTPDQFVLDITPMEQIAVSELRRLCTKCGSDFALQKMQSVEGLDEAITVAVLRQDLDAIMGKIAVVETMPEDIPATPPKSKSNSSKKTK